ncbi:hypothetical protein CCACVL1_02620 [Corchorus capsularis]|uniref:Uncharacterized protein n=1 Tax=Corchorus capsularis TaxID=210143 RepID=A0A1R3K7M1_COCAP|nr:hypothetical protein CCACVL1_02620 [Corchorus capsularis]
MAESQKYRNIYRGSRACPAYLVNGGMGELKYKEKENVISIFKRIIANQIRI